MTREEEILLKMAKKALSADTSSDIISREDAIDTICKEWCLETFTNCPHADDGFRCVGCDDVEALMALPSAEAVSRESYIKAVGYVEWLEKLIVDSDTFEWVCENINDREWCEKNCNYSSIQAECLRHLYKAKQSAEAEPKWTCTANFIAEQLERLKLLQTKFPSAEAVDGECVPIELKKRYPHSRDEDITDAFMRGYQAHAEAVQGEWVDTGNWMGIECSRCKCHSRYVTPFCPQCGARMKGGDSE